MDRRELATTLKAARARVQPADVGLPARLNRRVAGLRREELAMLAGISVDYLVRLEQARGPHPSSCVLAALARALRLSDDERDHLFNLAGTPPPRPGRIDSIVRASTQRLLDRLSDLPVLATDAASTLIAWNDMALALLGDLSSLPLDGRNVQDVPPPTDRYDHARLRRHVAAGHRSARRGLLGRPWYTSARGARFAPGAGHPGDGRRPRPEPAVI